MKLRMPSSRVGVVAIAAGALALSGTGGAIAAASITGKDIVNRSVEKVDLAPESVDSGKVEDGSLTFRDLAGGLKDAINQAGPAGPAGPEGPAGPAGPAGTAEYVGANWSQVDRNVIGNAFTQLRSGPVSANFGAVIEPPMGVGSLGIHTGSGADKAAFGNQVDFVGDKVAELQTVSYHVYTTGENVGISPTNLPNIQFEVDPNGPAVTGGYSTLVHVPSAAPANTWSEVVASADDAWYFTGGFGTSSGCNQANYCTLEEIAGVASEATIYTVQFSKGRDHAFTGAVDALTINDTTYDFEPLGVSSN